MHRHACCFHNIFDEFLVIKRTSGSATELSGEKKKQLIQVESRSLPCEKKNLYIPNG